MTNSSSQLNPQPKTTTGLTGHTRVPGLVSLSINCIRVKSQWQYQDGSGTLSGILARTIAITNIVKAYELVWIYRVNRSRHFSMFSALWCLEERIISASQGEFGVVVIGFGINLCLLQWLHHSCLFNVFGLYRISLSTTVSVGHMEDCEE